MNDLYNKRLAKAVKSEAYLKKMKEVSPRLDPATGVEVLDTTPHELAMTMGDPGSIQDLFNKYLRQDARRLVDLEMGEMSFDDETDFDDDKEFDSQYEPDSDNYLMSDPVEVKRVKGRVTARAEKKAKALREKEHKAIADKVREEMSKKPSGEEGA